MKNKLKRLAWLIPLTTSLLIGYFVFLGQNFLSVCEDKSALLAGGVIMLSVLVILFLLVIVKSSKGNFNLMFLFELILLVCYGLLYSVAIVPFNHYFTVSSRQDSIQNVILPSIACGKSMYVDYEMYCDNREKMYDSKLTSAVKNQHIARKDLDSLGFNDTIPLLDQVGPKMFILKSQLRPGNLYEETKKARVEWLENASENIKEWKAIGVIKSYTILQEELERFKNELVTYSLFQQENEGSAPFVYNCLVSDADQLFCRLEKTTIQSYIFLFILFLLGLLIYIFEPRDFRNTNIIHRIFHWKKSIEDDDTDVKL